MVAIFEVIYRFIPGISLTLNRVVTAGASLCVAREGHLRSGLIVPLLPALPLSHPGGSLEVSTRLSRSTIHRVPGIVILLALDFLARR